MDVQDSPLFVVGGAGGRGGSGLLSGGAGGVVGLNTDPALVSGTLSGYNKNHISDRTSSFICRPTWVKGYCIIFFALDPTHHYGLKC